MRQVMNKLKPGTTLIIPAKSSTPVSFNINRSLQPRLIELTEDYDTFLSLSEALIDSYQDKCCLTLENHGYEAISIAPSAVLANIFEVETAQYYKHKLVTREDLLAFGHSNSNKTPVADTGTPPIDFEQRIKCWRCFRRS